MSALSRRCHGRKNPSHYAARGGNGNATKIVAADLCISEETVKGHVRNILAKLGAKRSDPRGHDRALVFANLRLTTVTLFGGIDTGIYPR